MIIFKLNYIKFWRNQLNSNWFFLHYLDQAWVGVFDFWFVLEYCIEYTNINMDMNIWILISISDHPNYIGANYGIYVTL